MGSATSSLSRRNILFGFAGLAVAAVIAAPRLLPGGEQRARRLLASNPLTRRFVSLADAEQSEWAAQVGSTFAAEGGFRLRLAGVRPLASPGVRPAGVGRERAFVAVFDLLGGATMPGDLIYTMSHGEYAALPVFLSAAEDPRRMLAVFN